MSHKHHAPLGEKLKYVVIPVLIAVIGFSTYNVIEDLFADASAAVSTQKPQMQQKRVRYRFRRIYNGSDVMTASHVGGGLSSASFSSGSPFRSSINAVGAPAPLAVNGRRGTASASVMSGTVSVLESQQSLRSFASGGGSIGGGASSGGSSTGGLGGGIAAGGGYSISLPALPSLKTTVTTSGNLAALNGGETVSEGGGRSKRGVKTFGDGWWSDTDTGEGGTMDGDGNCYDEEGNLVYIYNPYTGEFVSQGSVDANSQAPIGGPLLPLLMLAAAYAAARSIRSCNKEV
ncbi:MAG: hypothetical protein IJS13_03190 [Paludibacteraceae bacterium]|nr:hypothetical protein [Paludibacteraceae bacterium]